MNAIIFRSTILIPLLGVPLARAVAAPDPVEQAIALYQGGQTTDAKHAFDTYLVDHPKDPRALYFAATINAENGQPAIAIQQALLLLQTAPGSLAALELEIQVYQALGDHDRRDDAIARLRSERDNLINPDTRYALLFIRDRFKIDGRVFIGTERFEKDGETIIRYTFSDASTGANPEHYLVLMSDPDTNARWRELAEMPENKLLYHLDAVDQQSDGSEKHTTYANYVGEPTYDRVRDEVTAILSGHATPLAGDPDPYWAAIREQSTTR